MKFYSRKKAMENIGEWQYKFAWWPTQVDEDITIWLEIYSRRRVVYTPQDGWYFWERRWVNGDGYYSKPWASPLESV